LWKRRVLCVVRQVWRLWYCVWRDRCCVVGYCVWGDRDKVIGYCVWVDRGGIVCYCVWETGFEFQVIVCGETGVGI